MAARDPETGQFVAGDQAGSFRDYIVNNFSYVGTVPASDLPAAFPVFETIIIGDAAPGLDRSELGHVVMAQVQMTASAPGTETEESALSYAMELSTDGDPKVAEPEDLFTNIENPEEFGPIDTRQKETNDAPEVIHSELTTSEASFRDLVNTLGGGADALSRPIQRSYPAGGQRVDRNDNLFLHVVLDDFLAADIVNSAVQVGVVGQLFIRVMED